MRRSRMLVPGEMDGVYHVVSRVVDRRLVFGGDEKRRFVLWMKAYAGFSGLDLLSWCVMDNHFHLLVRVPAATDVPLAQEQVLRRLRLIYPAADVAAEEAMLADATSDEARRLILERHTRRMGDLGLFMKTLKQRFTQWFNGRHGRRGTLWEERYRSTVVEGTDSDGKMSHAARVVAAYIDLNPVRAGLVEDPAECRWSSYAAAVGGDRTALEGLRMLWGLPKARALAEHRMLVYEEGSEEKVPEHGEKSKRVGIDARKVWEERQRGGRLPLRVMLRLRVRYLTDGAVVGGREFVDAMARSWRERQGDARMAQGNGVAMRFGDWGGLYALRNLKVRVIGDG
jgi:putative transposase